MLESFYSSNPKVFKYSSSSLSLQAYTPKTVFTSARCKPKAIYTDRIYAAKA